MFTCGDQHDSGIVSDEVERKKNSCFHVRNTSGFLQKKRKNKSVEFNYSQKYQSRDFAPH